VVTLTRAASVALLAAVLLPSWAACSSILGLEEARLDSTSGTGGGNGDAAPPTLCERYCTSVMTNCAGDDKLYFSTKECLATCAVLPPGDDGDDGVNTVQCRLRYADFAGDVGETKDNCPAAGPGGNGVCGSNCDGFCSMAIAACSSILVDLQSNIDADSCDRICGQLPELGGFAISQDEGNSVQCRIYHASAATLDAKTHCRHVAGIGPCSAVDAGQ
jgi:hypothetical protein